MPPKPRIGKDAEVKILARYLHPSEHLQNKYANFESLKAHLTLDGCKVLRQERKNISKKEQLVVVVSHPDFDGVELYAVKRWFKVTKQGPPDLFFDAVENAGQTGAPRQNITNGEEDEVLEPGAHNPAASVPQNGY